MKAKVLHPDDPLWSGFVGKVRHQFYQRPEYVSIEATRTGGDPVALYVEDGDRTLLVPLVLNTTRIGGKGLEILDAVSPYGYPGFLVDAQGEERSFVQGALRAAAPILAGVGMTSVFLRLDPLFNDPGSLDGLGIIVEHGACIWIDLNQSEEDLNRQLREGKKYRSHLRAAERQGLVVRFDSTTAYFDAFIDIYYRTMDAVGAEKYYYFDRDYFYGLRAMLGPDLKLCVVEHKGDIHAAGLFAASGGVVQSLLTGKEQGGYRHATQLMMIHVRDWAKREGHQVFHLGGGVGGNESDPVANYKRQFSKLSKPFFTWRLVVNDKSFSEAITAWESMAGRRADDLQGFFPPYRKPFLPESSQEDMSGAKTI